MVDAHKIEREINQHKAHLAFLEKRLIDLQQNCDHHFQGDHNYEKCLKCNKVNVLYY